MNKKISSFFCGTALFAIFFTASCKSDLSGGAEEKFVASLTVSGTESCFAGDFTENVLEYFLVEIKNQKDEIVFSDNVKSLSHSEKIESFVINITYFEDEYPIEEEITKENANRLSLFYTFKENNVFKAAGNVVYNGKKIEIAEKELSFSAKNKETPPAPENPNPESPETPENPEPPQTEKFPVTLDLLKQVYANYLSEEVSSKGTILTAQTIKLIGDISSGLYVENTLDDNDKIYEYLKATYKVEKLNKTLLDNLENKTIEITKNGKRDIGNDYGYYIRGGMDYANDLGDEWNKKYNPVIAVDSYKIKKGNVVLDGTFNYNEIDIEKNAGVTISTTENTKFSMKQVDEEGTYLLISPKAIFNMYSRLFKVSYNEDSSTNITLEDVITKTIKTSDTPKLDYYIHGEEDEEAQSSYLIALHKIYENKEDKLNLDGSIDKLFFRDYNSESYISRSFKGKDFLNGQTLFKGNNYNPNINLPNMSANVLVKINAYGIDYLSNVVITGDYKEKSNIDLNTRLTNVIFEGDVSKIRNSYKDQFNGVVYFKDLPYNNNKEDGTKTNAYVNGLLKLDKLEGVSYDNFSVRFENSILDLRGRDNLNQNPLEGYNINNDEKKTITQISEVHGVYFTKKGLENVKGLGNTSNLEEDENLERIFEILIKRIKQKNDSHLYKVYVDEEKKNNISRTVYFDNADKFLAGNKTPRTLEEFEYYGNNGKFENSAYNSYKQDELDKMDKEEREKLENDKDIKELALNNRKIALNYNA